MRIALQALIEVLVNHIETCREKSMVSIDELIASLRAAQMGLDDTASKLSDERESQGRTEIAQAETKTRQQDTLMAFLQQLGSMQQLGGMLGGILSQN